MLDAFDAGADRLLDRPRGIGVDGDVGAPVLRRFDRRADLGLGILRDVERIEIRRHASACHQLDVARSAHQLFTHAAQDFVGAVGNARHPQAFGKMQLISRRPRQVVDLAEIAVTRGLRNGRARRPDARPDKVPFINAALEPERIAANVAAAGEPAHQHLAGRFALAQHGIVAVGRHQQQLRYRRHRHVNMGVDQSRHQRASSAGDNRGGRLRHDRRCGNAFNDIPLDEDIGWRRQRSALAVEDANVLEQRQCRSGGGLLGQRKAGQTGGRQPCSDAKAHSAPQGTDRNSPPNRAGEIRAKRVRRSSRTSTPIKNILPPMIMRTASPGMR